MSIILFLYFLADIVIGCQKIKGVVEIISEEREYFCHCGYNFIVRLDNDEFNLTNCDLDGNIAYTCEKCLYLECKIGYILHDSSYHFDFKEEVTINKSDDNNMYCVLGKTIDLYYSNRHTTFLKCDPFISFEDYIMFSYICFNIMLIPFLCFVIGSVCQFIYDVIKN